MRANETFCLDENGYFGIILLRSENDRGRFSYYSLEARDDRILFIAGNIDFSYCCFVFYVSKKIPARFQFFKILR